jgi:hypothetical protein
VFRGGMAPGPLPFSGGYAEQPAGLMAAFDEIAWADSQMRERDKT